MKKTIYFSFFLSMLFMIWGCSSTRSGKGENPTKFREKLARVTRMDLQNETRKILQSKYQFQFFRFEDSENQLYVETDWRTRTPFEDEINSGIIDVRSKIIITAYPRELTNPYGLWVPTFEGLNEVKLQGATDWVSMPLTDQARDYFSKIADDLSLEFRTGIREY